MGDNIIETNGFFLFVSQAGRDMDRLPFVLVPRGQPFIQQHRDAVVTRANGGVNRVAADRGPADIEAYRTMARLLNLRANRTPDNPLAIGRWVNRVPVMLLGARSDRYWSSTMSLVAMVSRYNNK